MKTYQNDTFGELTEAEHQALRQAAHPCIRCGMLADVDPVLHASRYGHRPAYRDGTALYEFWPRTMTWTEMSSPEQERQYAAESVERDTSGAILRGPSLACGCPLDADCDGRHPGALP